MAMRKIRIHDTVKVIAGKFRGAEGVVKEINVSQNRVVVENVNKQKVHKKGNQQGDPGKIIEREGAIHLSNVMIVDGKTKHQTRVGFKLNKQKRKIRYAKKSQQEIRNMR